MLYMFLGMSFANAQDFPDLLSKARESLLNKEYDKALGLLDEAQTAIGSSATLVKPNDLASIWYYRGVAKKLLKQDPLQDWRQALIYDIAYKWESDFIDSSATSDFFLNIRDEVRDRPQTVVCVPEKYGQAKLYVDGLLLKGHSDVPEGNHLAQIQCPKGEVFSTWTDFSKDLDWVKMCNYTFDVEDMPVQEEEDEFADFGGFGAKKTPTASLSSNASQCVKAEVGPVNKTLVLSAVGTAVVSGVVYLLALQGRSQYDDPDNADIKTVSDLEDLRTSVNTQVYTSAGLGGVALGIYGYAIWKMRAGATTSTK